MFGVREHRERNSRKKKLANSASVRKINWLQNALYFGQKKNFEVKQNHHHSSTRERSHVDTTLHQKTFSFCPW